MSWIRSARDRAQQRLDYATKELARFMTTYTEGDEHDERRKRKLTIDVTSAKLDLEWAEAQYREAFPSLHRDEVASMPGHARPRRPEAAE